MESSSQGSQPYREVAAAHIRELSDIKERIPIIIQQAAFSVSNLTNKPLDLPSKSPPTHAPDSVHSRKDTLRKANDDLLIMITELRTNLHAQIDALAKEGVIPAQQTIRHVPALSHNGQPEEARPNDSETNVMNEGLGSLDVGVLNARAGVREVQGEEALARVKAVLEDLAKKKASDQETTADK